MKVMLLTETLLPGGAETFIVRFANALAETLSVTLVTMHSELVHPALRDKISDRVDFKSISLPAKPLLWKISSLLRKLRVDWSPVDHFVCARVRNLVEHEAPDLVHSHLFHADACASKVVQGVRVPIAHVLTVHGDYAAYSCGEADAQVVDFAARLADIVERADAIVGVAEAHIGFFGERFPLARDRLHLIYNGFDVPAAGPPLSKKQLGLPEDKFLFGMVSRGVEKKGWARAVEAFERLNRQDAALVLVGEGPAIERIKAGTRSNAIVFAGFSPDPAELIRHFDVCLLPTLFPNESLPTVITEYLAWSKPIIATDVGEIRKMLADPDGRLAGLLVDLKKIDTSADELELQMTLLLDDARLRFDLASRAPRAFEKFRMERCANKYLQLYRKLSC